MCFNLPPLPTQNMQNWMSDGEVPDMSFSDSIQALLSATGDPSIFQLSNFNPDSLLTNPEGEIEVSMGHVPFSYDQQSNFPDPANLFGDFDFSAAAAGPSSQPMDDSSAGPLSPIEHAPEFSSLFQTNNIADSSSNMPQPDFGSFSADSMYQYLNLEPSMSASVPPPETTPSRPPPPVHSQSMPFMTNDPEDADTAPPGPYIPPAGAAHSSTRRVAASWKPNFAPPDSPVDHSPTRPWGMSAS